MIPDRDIFYGVSLRLKSPLFACSVAALAEIQSYTITYLIKHYRAQQDGEARRRVGACVCLSADDGRKPCGSCQGFVVLLNVRIHPPVFKRH